MTAASIITRDTRANAASRLSGHPLAVAVAIVAATVAIRATGTVDSDVGWQLWIAHQLNGGIRLYRDVIETNPPLWFWMGMPVDWLSHIVHIRSDHLLIGTIGLLAVLALAAVDRLLPPVAPSRRTLLLGFAGLIMVAMPWLQFGQREQIVLIGAIPYSALIAARRTGRGVPAGFAFAVGACAAGSFALKHYFLIVPILLDLWLLTGQRKQWRPLRPETAAVAIVGIVYGLAFLVFGRAYLSTALPLILLAYGPTGAEHLIDLFQPAVLTALATLGFLFASPRLVRSEASGLAAALMVAAAGFGLAYFIQAKGWTYHAVPLAGCAALALATCLAGGEKPTGPMALAAPALLFLPFTIAAQQAMRVSKPAEDVRRAVEGLQPGDSVGFIGTDPSLGWNVTLQDGFRYPSRYNGFWMMRAVVRNEALGSPNSRLADFGRQAVRETVQDFQCTPPKRIIVARPTPEAAKSGDFDILRFFLRDPQFAKLLSHYRPVQRTSVERFDLVSPLQPGVECLRRAA